MKKINWQSEHFNIIREANNVRVISREKNVFLADQTVNNIAEVMIANLDSVRKHYLAQVNDACLVDEHDINTISSLIVLYYLNMYNSWRKIYIKFKDKSLLFDENDFKHVSTYDMVFSFLKAKYPDGWIEKSSVLLKMTVVETRLCYAKRGEYYNK